MSAATEPSAPVEPDEGLGVAVVRRVVVDHSAVRQVYVQCPPEPAQTHGSGSVACRHALLHRVWPDRGQPHQLTPFVPLDRCLGYDAMCVF